MSRRCIAVLTRGYENFGQYESLIRRNMYISNCLKDKTMDILIFHEGNILPNDQTKIQQITPELKLKFVNIMGPAFRREKESVPFAPETKGFGMGYRHMCSFWFVDFWHFVQDYDYVLRIDEDCFVNFDIEVVFSDLKTALIVAGRYDADVDYVTIGMNRFSLDFVEANVGEFAFTSNQPKQPGGPYTNLFGLSLEPLRKNAMLAKYIEAIDESDRIYSHRWGDLPLWGEAVQYILGENQLKIDKRISYFHTSHNSMVNPAGAAL